jgi:putative lipoprotein
MNRYLLGSLIVLAGCSTGQGDSAARDSTPARVPSVVDTVTATITYRERMALPDDAHVKVSLVDMSRMDAPATVISTEDRVAAGAQVPFVFSLPYVLDQIPMNARLVVQARIEQGGRTLFTSTLVHPVVTQGAPKQVEVVVERVRGDR